MKLNTFRDFDAFAGSVRDIESKMTLHNPQDRIWKLGAVDLSGVDVQIGELGSGNIVEGALRRDGYLFYLPTTAASEYRANGINVSLNQIMAFDPGAEFLVSTSAAHDWRALFVPTEHLQDPNSHTGPSGRPPRGAVVISNQPLAALFGAQIRAVVETAMGTARFETSPSARAAREQLLAIASLILSETRAFAPNKRGRTPYGRMEIAARCQRHLDARLGEPVQVSELASAAGVSEPTLRAVFRKVYGIGPARYLQLRQIDLVRQLLVAGDPAEHTVADILVNCGVWEFGRFAARYRQLYGELPSETLRAPRT